MNTEELYKQYTQLLRGAPDVQGVQLKLIQQWMGHSNISTMANIYSHVDAYSTFQCAMVIDETLGKGE